MTNALNKVKVEFPNADISIFSLLKRKDNITKFTTCDLNKMTHPEYILFEKRENKLFFISRTLLTKID